MCSLAAKTRCPSSGLGMMPDVLCPSLWPWPVELGLCELPRIHLPNPRVNKDKKWKGRGVMPRPSISSSPL